MGLHSTLQRLPVFVAAVMLSVLGPLAGPRAGAAATAERVYFRPCDTLLYRPVHVQLACGDGNFGLDGMRWRGWDGGVARGWGFAYYNDCKPDCADGHFHRYRASVTLDRRQRCPGALQYLRIRVRGTGREPRPMGTSLRCDGSYDVTR